jgi:hypothetical protein
MRTLLLAVLMIAACGGSKPPAPAKPIGNQAAEPEEMTELEAARAAGVLGMLSCPDGGSTYGGSSYGGSTYGCSGGGAFANLTGTGDISSGFDDTNIYGGLLGNESDPDATGIGLGNTGTGSGGGGTGEGTIGTGRYGTIGHDSGTGSGYGVGKASIPKVKLGTATSDAGLDKAIIRRYVKRNIPRIRYCYEKALLNDPKLAGKLVASFTIGADGKVTSSTAAGVHADVESCVAAVFQAIEFPKPKGGGSINVSYPFTFSPA